MSRTLEELERFRRESRKDKKGESIYALILDELLLVVLHMLADLSLAALDSLTINSPPLSVFSN